MMMKIFEQDGLVDTIYKYIHTQIELTKLEVQERLEVMIKKLILLLVVVMLTTLFLLFLLFSLAFYLNSVLSSDFWGFVIVTILIGIPLGIFGFRLQKSWKDATAQQHTDDSTTNLP